MSNRNFFILGIMLLVSGFFFWATSNNLKSSIGLDTNIVIESNGERATIRVNGEEFPLMEDDIPGIVAGDSGRICVNYHDSGQGISSSLSNTFDNVGVIFANGKLTVGGVSIEKLIKKKRE
ncbi:hypothetical protein ACFL08_04340 [Patescibacteria group bacterium]